MADELADRINIGLVNRRLDIINEEGNKAVKELMRTGRLRTTVDQAFRTPEHLIKLITHICVLKRYADSAAQAHGERMTFETWKAFFEQFDRGMHELPVGKLS
jgi:hypothetical protein